MKTLFSAVLIINLGAAFAAAVEVPAAEFELPGVTAESIKGGEVTGLAVPAIPEASAPSSYSVEQEAKTKAVAYSDSAIPGIIMPFFAWYNHAHAAHSNVGAPSKSVQFVTIPGGRFMMGTDNGKKYFEDAVPVREVAVKTFEMSKTAVTVEQYAECVINGWCSEPGTRGYCNWGQKDRKYHPVNCVTWDQAARYAEFKSKQRGFEGVRLPTEAEWEYAAKSGGRYQKYPWGNEDASCDRAVMANSQGVVGCGKNRTLPVCSRPDGNTAQGLCDMAGNVRQWVHDTYRDSYKGAPADGSALEVPGSDRVARGGSFFTTSVGRLRTDCRYYYDAGSYDFEIGFRLAR
ncbi:MAG: SUMF1/EgtB/PvdO family nonheme iron enzyme [Elusimicrobiales bacterium]|nr:SUMF1/EgtB/PvdO family nonheme iron enzyme [Elusimicrobiales bacterium]